MSDDVPDELTPDTAAISTDPLPPPPDGAIILLAYFAISYKSRKF
jgi:hypothetical protein